VSSQLLSRPPEESTISPLLSGYLKVRSTAFVDLARDSLLLGIKAKVENKHQYEEYLEELKPIREELGINLKEDLYPEGTDSPHYNP
jgi:hypothetical protein